MPRTQSGSRFSPQFLLGVLALSRARVRVAGNSEKVHGRTTEKEVRATPRTYRAHVGGR
jgi:hypothetical protein